MGAFGARRAGGSGRGDELQTVARTLEVLCCFTSAEPEWGVTGIANHLGIGKSVAHRIVSTLEEYQFLEKTESRRYRLGIRTLELGNVFRFDRRVLMKAEPLLRKLADETGSYSHLGVLDGREVLELARGVGPGAVAFSPHPVYRMPAHASGLGKVLLAGLPDEAFRQFIGARLTLAKYTEATIVDPETLRSQLAEVRAKGFATDDEEIRVGCRCLAVPVAGREGVVAAISVSNSKDKFTDEALARILPKLQETAKAIGAWM